MTASDSEMESDAAMDENIETLEPKVVNTKFIKILTVIGYMICVSSAGIMLSLYYIFLWDPYSSMATSQALTAAASTSARSAVGAGTLSHECAKHIEQALHKANSAGALEAKPLYAHVDLAANGYNVQGTSAQGS